MACPQASEMVSIAGGEYRPLYINKDFPKTKVKAFLLDIDLVTNQQFYQFVRRNLQWEKNQIPSIFTEEGYLKHWSNKSEHWQPNVQIEDLPVTNVSWFSADAFCRAEGKRLLTVDEWEYVARASKKHINGNKEESYNQRILDWYSKPQSSLASSTLKANYNFWGVNQLHGVVWEWTEDFNSSLVNGESRNDSSIDSKLFCAAGAAGSADPSNYAAFMRFGFRSSLQAKFTLGSLGFRCAK